MGGRDLIQQFEWDAEKEKANIKKHGIDFETAKYVFNDEYRVEFLDSAHSTLKEFRYITIGFVDQMLTVIYTDRNDAIRIIYARIATMKEARLYYDDNNKIYS